MLLFLFFGEKLPDRIPRVCSSSTSQCTVTDCTVQYSTVQKCRERSSSLCYRLRLWEHLCLKNNEQYSTAAAVFPFKNSRCQGPSDPQTLYLLYAREVQDSVIIVSVEPA